MAAAAGVNPKTVRKWRQRCAAEGEAGLVGAPGLAREMGLELPAPISIPFPRGGR